MSDDKATEIFFHFWGKMLMYSMAGCMVGYAFQAYFSPLWIAAVGGAFGFWRAWKEFRHPNFLKEDGTDVKETEPKTEAND